MGADGALVAGPDGVAHVTDGVAAVEVADLTGAGDSFAGALIGHLLRGAPLIRAVAAANAAGSAAASRLGRRRPGAGRGTQHRHAPRDPGTGGPHMKLTILGGGGVRMPAFVRAVLTGGAHHFDEICLLEPDQFRRDTIGRLAVRDRGRARPAGRRSRSRPIRRRH